MGDIQLVSHEQQLSLSLRVRVGWATAIVDRVLHLYSRRFQECYGGLDAVEYAWSYVEGEPDVTAVRHRLSTRLEAALPEIESMGYPYYALYPAFALLAEIDCGDGKGSDTAVMYCGGGYMAAILHRYGGRAISPRFHDQIQAPFHRFVWACFLLAVDLKAESVNRMSFDPVPLGMFPQLPEVSEIRRMGPPPDDEVS